MKVIETSLRGALIIEPKVLGDARGFFYESYHEAKFRAAGLSTNFVQSNVSSSSRGVLRGLHYQWPNPQGKLVSVLSGEVYDVAVDIRRQSPTFGHWAAALLTGDNHRHFWIPEGFAHGFCVLSETATFTYQCTALYEPSHDRAVRWNDATLGIDWPVTDPLLSDKDGRAPLLADIPQHALPEFNA
ncbi:MULTISPECIES: dTDP-4-dehydrorhamnose 3,5-epimerase [unclassified Dyella]|uniref:dTDP-4-dehydrorhamnose 3,5-epimerase n=1 Tax=unclassified Dyella TaxID=2634549 RepID=UPI000C85235B|nr:MULTISPECIES: dTDP-4-dehydrorhamnose 3,5-epimerase [unclassified Dyella]MDR3444407.1 dTDP-4-dehydrorhamnose 3,5-epimerase [Dyella sp.]PMQ06010.1 dTDP-4-dehydrorhamnose 3,5-epimerase [Dyella sp. AD56]